MRIGFVTKTPTTLDFEGDVKIIVVDQNTSTLPTGTAVANDGSATFTVDIPWFFLLGASYRVTPKLLVTGETAYRTWGDVESKETEYYQSYYGTTARRVSETNWIDNWTLGVGLKYQFSPKFVGTTGIVSTTHALESEYKTVASGCSDLNYFNFAVGAGYMITEKIEAICSMYYYIAQKETDPSGNTYERSLLGSVFGIRGSF